jgi:hypothetical protein
MRTITYAQAINEAMAEEMRRDPSVILYGEDVANFGGIFKITKGLKEEFGEERVFDTPTRFGRGKDLKAASHRARARSAVSKRIRFALDQIRQANPALAQYLTDSIRTGYNCVYLPKHKINWNL